MNKSSDALGVGKQRIKLSHGLWEYSNVVIKLLRIAARRWSGANAIHIFKDSLTMLCRTKSLL